ncbi:hypothetical protein PoB_002755400 [Plakobranchus ocellatus]|uniref:Uncharacterized protein n=1 Tax=Plakobranchus ocellatus TaxID=259542 RepID=A0AAV4A4B0_9GAST|nr:hypothetical protein PoB_002755400 [Plakobranchus ocellatus]
MDDIEEKCEDNLTDSDSTPILPNKSFSVLNNTSEKSLPNAPSATAASASSTSSSPALSEHSSSVAQPQEDASSSTKQPQPLSPPSQQPGQNSQPSKEISDCIPRQNPLPTAPSPQATRDVSTSKETQHERGSLIGSQSEQQKKMASASSSTVCSSSGDASLAPGLTGSYNNPKYRIASSLSSSSTPSSSASSSAPYKRMPQLHKLEK